MEGRNIMHTFIGRYTEHPVRLSYTGENDETIKERVVFRNAIFQTEDGQLAEALRKHPHFGTDWFEKKGIKEKANKFRHAEDKELYNQLNSLTHSQLKNLAFEKKLAFYKPENGNKPLNKMKKEEVIDLLMDKRHNLGEHFMG